MEWGAALSIKAAEKHIQYQRKCPKHMWQKNAATACQQAARQPTIEMLFKFQAC